MPLPSTNLASLSLFPALDPSGLKGRILRKIFHFSACCRVIEPTSLQVASTMRPFVAERRLLAPGSSGVCGHRPVTAVVTRCRQVACCLPSGAFNCVLPGQFQLFPLVPLCSSYLINTPRELTRCLFPISLLWCRRTINASAFSLFSVIICPDLSKVSSNLQL